MSYSVDIGHAGDEKLQELLRPSLVDQDAMDARVSATFAGEPDAIAKLVSFLQAEGQAQDDQLALLSSFQNADKHRQLLTVAEGLQDPVVYFDLGNGVRTVYDGFEHTPGQIIGNGAVILRLPSEMDMEVEGSALVALSVGDDLRNLRKATALDAIYMVAGACVKDLSKFVTE